MRPTHHCDRTVHSPRCTDELRRSFRTLRPSVTMATLHGAARRQRAIGEFRMTNVIKFGTDGWRAIIAEDFTFTNVRALAASVARYLKETGLGERGLVIGYDTRFGSDRFAEAVA